ncbi:hypothetical protein E8E11_011889 [Didymella keratinophila]|nr:hypothetical protein E8E11_011889 [Didymella keratinophila]
MNTSTTSLVSTVSSSASFKPYICVQPSPHTHASQHKSRIHCASCPQKQHQLLPKLRHLLPSRAPTVTRTTTTPSIQDRERALQTRAAALSQREQKVRLREEMLEKRELGLKARFYELAQQRVRDACDAAARKEDLTRPRGGGWTRWKCGWKRDATEKGWAKWEEGRFG